MSKGSREAAESAKRDFVNGAGVNYNFLSFPSLAALHFFPLSLIINI